MKLSLTKSSEDYFAKEKQKEEINITDLLPKAIEFAKEKHKGQTRKGTDIPYVTHLFAVAKILKEECADIKTIVVGMLHDTLEDTKTTIDELTEEFGVEIASMVDTLSEKKSLPYNKRKHMQSIRIKYSSKEVKMVKCADCISNLTDTYYELKRNANVWEKFNAGKEDIQKHYIDIISALDELKELKMYKKLIVLYHKVFDAWKIRRVCTECVHMDRIPTPDPYDPYAFDEEMFVCEFIPRILSLYNSPNAIQFAPDDCPIQKELEDL